MNADEQRGSAGLTVYIPSFCSLSRHVRTMMRHMHFLHAALTVYLPCSRCTRGRYLITGVDNAWSRRLRCKVGQYFPLDHARALCIQHSEYRTGKHYDRPSRSVYARTAALTPIPRRPRISTSVRIRRRGVIEPSVYTAIVQNWERPSRPVAHVRRDVPVFDAAAIRPRVDVVLCLPCL